ncbi:MAG TPA: type II toxin-antitoxin system prevent-host-death family antitoxin [Acetobacteraceae bacterium]|nr:type II toxin-antitoxin system prevent-host-death family antitoxin [Acetobacteraceae bacterium]
MPTVTASEYSKKIGLYQTVAQREPVVITSHGREETVLISADEYRRLTRRRRRPYLLEELPDEDWKAIEEAHAALKEQTDC